MGRLHATMLRPFERDLRRETAQQPRTFGDGCVWGSRGLASEPLGAAGAPEEGAEAPLAAGELGVGSFRAAVCKLHRPEALRLEPVAAVLVQLLVGFGEARAGEPEFVRGPRHGVQQLLPCLRGGVRHRASHTTLTVCSPTATTSPRCSWRPRRASGSPFTVTASASNKCLASAPESARADSLSSCPRRIMSPSISISSISPSWHATAPALLARRLSRGHLWAE